MQEPDWQEAQWEEAPSTLAAPPAPPTLAAAPVASDFETEPESDGKIFGLDPKLLLFAGLGLMGLFAVLIVLAVLFLPPFRLAAAIGGGGGKTLDAEHPSVSHPDGIVVEYGGQGSLRIRIESIPREAFLAGQGDADYDAALNAIPPYLEMKSPLYLIESDGEGSSLISISIPNNSTPLETLDLYTWNQETGRWEFVAGGLDGTLTAMNSPERPANVAIFQTISTSPLIGTVVEQNQVLDTQAASALNLVMPSGVNVDPASGLLNGAPVGGWQLGAGYAVTPHVLAENGSALAGLLADPAIRESHITDLLSFVVNDGYNGVAIDYRGVDAANREAYLQFLSELGARLDSQGKLLIVVLPSPFDATGALNPGAYDLRTIGRVADLVVMRVGSSPTAFAIDGQAEKALRYAIGQMPRVKLHLAIPVTSYDETSQSVISYEEALNFFGQASSLTTPPDGGVFQPGTPLTFDLQSQINSLQVDQVVGTYNFTVRDEGGDRSIRLAPASSVRAWMDEAAAYRIGGYTLMSLLGSGNDPALLTAVNEFKASSASSVPSQIVINWNVTGASGAVLNQATGLGTPFTWQADQPGEFSVGAQISGGGVYDRGVAAVQIGEAPTPTQTPRPTAGAPVVLPTTDPNQPTPTPKPTVVAPPPVAPGGGSFGALELGGQIPYGSIPPASTMQSAAMTWVKYQVKWGPGAPASAACDMVSVGRASGFKVLLSIPGEPFPTSIDYNGYVSFVGQVAAACQPDAIEVWNEQNYYFEWPRGQISASDYVSKMLAPAYNAIKAASPNTMVIIGGPTPTGVSNDIAREDATYVREMAAAGAGSYANCIGLHWNTPATSAYATSGHPAANNGTNEHYSWYYTPMLDIYYNAFGGKLPICITEVGVVTAEGYGALGPNWQWAAGNTVANQAQWLGEAVTIGRQRGSVRLFIVWNVNFTQFTPEDPQGGYAIIRPGGACPACASLAAAMQ